MQFTFSKSEFDVPEGKYLAKFLGVKPLPSDPANPRLGQDGKPMGPAVAWEFEVQDEPHRGKKADRVTAAVPSPKNSCGRFLAAVADTILKDGQTVDVTPLVGQLYRITVEAKENGKGTRVSEAGLARVYGNPAAPPQPPKPPAPAVPAPPPDSKWDLYGLSGKWEATDAAGVLHFLNSNRFEAGNVYVKPAGADQSAMKSASEYGFVSDWVPF